MYWSGCNFCCEQGKASPKPPLKRALKALSRDTKTIKVGTIYHPTTPRSLGLSTLPCTIISKRMNAWPLRAASDLYQTLLSKTNCIPKVWRKYIQHLLPNLATIRDSMPRAKALGNNRRRCVWQSTGFCRIFATDQNIALCFCRCTPVCHWVRSCCTNVRGPLNIDGHIREITSPMCCCKLITSLDSYMDDAIQSFSKHSYGWSALDRTQGLSCQ